MPEKHRCQYFRVRLWHWRFWRCSADADAFCHDCFGVFCHAHLRHTPSAHNDEPAYD